MLPRQARQHAANSENLNSRDSDLSSSQQLFGVPNWPSTGANGYLQGFGSSQAAAMATSSSEAWELGVPFLRAHPLRCDTPIHDEAADNAKALLRHDTDFLRQCRLVTALYIYIYMYIDGSNC